MTAFAAPAPAEPAQASPAIRLVTFAALAAFAAGQWASLVDAPPVGRLALVVGVVTAGGAAMVALGSSRLPPMPRRAIALITAIGTTLLALVAMGISIHLLWPGGWGELGANLDRGLGGLAGDVDYPYRGANEWARLAILAAAPLALGAAAALAFWPAGDRAARRLRMLGLAVVIGLYAAAVATDPPDAALLRGLLLLVLIGAWLWLPALRRRDALAAGTIVACAGVLALPVAARLDAADPWLDYTEWTWSDNGGTSYRWNHTYGPIDWPRDGQTMLAAKSERALYWKTVVLDRFDGVRWERSDVSGFGERELPTSAAGVELPPSADPQWLERVEVTVEALRSQLVVGAGKPIAIRGVEDAVTAPDGTTRLDGDPLRDGDSYTLTAYVPDPTPAQMRTSPEAYPSSLASYTQVTVPQGPGIYGPGPPQRTEEVTLPLRGYDDGSSRAAGQLAASPYADAYRLAQRLTAGQPTTYDAVRAIEDELLTAYAYSEDPPNSDYPLAAFLSDDRIGYCQHFSGAMALMLRMAGIPSRVVSGFAPGTPGGEGQGVFLVEDFDAHSWVEVYFNGIGWVSFDPTPAASPAALETRALPDLAGDHASGDPTQLENGREPIKGSARPERPETSSGGALWTLPVALLIAALAVAAALVAARTVGHRRRSPSVAAAAQLRELRGALERLGFPTSGGRTLMALETGLRQARKPAAARYVAALRAHRYRDPDRPPPTLAERRALRRELTSSRSLSSRLRGLLSIPPGGPRRAG